MIEQRTLQIDGNIIYCYADGSVEWYTRSRNGKVYKCHTFGCKNGNGYLDVAILGKHYTVHKLIALAFHSKADDSFEVDHIDRNKCNNQPINLHWVSKKINLSNRYVVDMSIKKHGVRKCENVKAYTTEHWKHQLRFSKPDGNSASTGYLTEEELALLKPMSMKERYFAYQDILIKRKENKNA